MQVSHTGARNNKKSALYILYKVEGRQRVDTPSHSKMTKSRICNGITFRLLRQIKLSIQPYLILENPFTSGRDIHFQTRFFHPFFPNCRFACPLYRSVLTIELNWCFTGFKNLIRLYMAASFNSWRNFRIASCSWEWTINLLLSTGNCLAWDSNPNHSGEGRVVLKQNVFTTRQRRPLQDKKNGYIRWLNCTNEGIV